MSTVLSNASGDATAAAPILTVTLADGEEAANIFAKLLKQHIETIVEADPAKAAAARAINGKLGLHSTEPDAKITVVFDNSSSLIIRNGFDDDLDATITGTLKLQTETLTGQENPYTSMLKRNLKVGMRWKRPLFSLQTYRFLMVPESLRPPKES